MHQTDRWTSSYPGIDAAANPTQVAMDEAAASERSRRLSEGVPAIVGAQPDGQPGVSGHSIGRNGCSNSLASLIHDARNMVSAMDLYCDLLAEPGVLAPPFVHYAGDLRVVSSAGRRLLEELAVAESLSGLPMETPRQAAVQDWMSAQPGHDSNALLNGKRAVEPLAPRPYSEKHRRAESSLFSSSLAGSRSHTAAVDRRLLPGSQRIGNLAEELRANRNLLTALVGPRIVLDLSIGGGERPIAMTGDDLTRVLVNLVRNAADAMPSGGHLQVRLEEGAEYLSLLFIDDGPGIPEQLLESIFSPGFSSHFPAPSVESSKQAANSSADSTIDSAAWPVQHRGLGLSIVRSIVNAAGGAIWAANKNSFPAAEPVQEAAQSAAISVGSPLQQSGNLCGAVLVIEFPLLDSRNST